MMNTRELKEKLIRVKENPLQLEDEEITELTYHMLPHIGSTDPELRDNLIYTYLTTWIGNNRVNKKRMKEILMECLNERHVLLQIGELNTDSVFTRSFSVLTITSLIWNHNHVAPFLEKNEIEEITETMFIYAQKEKDFRGYVPDKGWAHSVAHFADWLDEMALCSQVNQADLKQILTIIGTLMRTRDISFIYGEDERMVTAIVSVINRNLIEKEVILQWVHELSVLDMNNVLPNDSWHGRNIKSLCRSLYFRTFEDNELTWLSEAALHCLKVEGMRYI